jgi:hypothetical protein
MLRQSRSAEDVGALTSAVPGSDLIGQPVDSLAVSKPLSYRLVSLATFRLSWHGLHLLATRSLTSSPTSRPQLRSHLRTLPSQALRSREAVSLASTVTGT